MQFSWGNLVPQAHIFGGNFFQIIELFASERPETPLFEGKFDFSRL